MRYLHVLAIGQSNLARRSVYHCVIHEYRLCPFLGENCVPDLTADILQADYPNKPYRVVLSSLMMYYCQHQTTMTGALQVFLSTGGTSST